jgi:hypothetical protein
MQKVTSIIYIPQEKIAKGLMCVTTAMRTACILVGVGGLKPTGEFRALAWHGSEHKDRHASDVPPATRQPAESIPHSVPFLHP